MRQLLNCDTWVFDQQIFRKVVIFKEKRYHTQEINRIFFMKVRPQILRHIFLNSNDLQLHISTSLMYYYNLKSKSLDIPFFTCLIINKICIEILD